MPTCISPNFSAPTTDSPSRWCPHTELLQARELLSMVSDLRSDQLEATSERGRSPETACPPSFHTPEPGEQRICSKHVSGPPRIRSLIDQPPTGHVQQ